MTTISLPGNTKIITDDGEVISAPSREAAEAEIRRRKGRAA